MKHLHTRIALCLVLSALYVFIASMIYWSGESPGVAALVVGFIWTTSRITALEKRLPPPPKTDPGT